MLVHGRLVGTIVVGVAPLHDSIEDMFGEITSIARRDGDTFDFPVSALEILFAVLVDVEKQPVEFIEGAELAGMDEIGDLFDFFLVQSVDESRDGVVWGFSPVGGIEGEVRSRFEIESDFEISSITVVVGKGGDCEAGVA
ncbi:hypothetical protein AA313_de0210102 [Arthrobotrys entomopaga]|nr:hypothetical protein AA313_de0210102 [Arthrobotrys entomopaga]